MTLVLLAMYVLWISLAIGVLRILKREIRLLLNDLFCKGADAIRKKAGIPVKSDNETVAKIE